MQYHVMATHWKLRLQGAEAALCVGLRLVPHSFLTAPLTFHLPCCGVSGVGQLVPVSRAFFDFHLSPSAVSARMLTLLLRHLLLCTETVVLEGIDMFRPISIQNRNTHSYPIPGQLEVRQVSPDTFMLNFDKF